jgi:hypothetical protein
MKKLFGVFVFVIGLLFAVNTSTYAANPLVGGSSGGTVVADEDLATVKGTGFYSALYSSVAQYYGYYSNYYANYANYYNYNGSSAAGTYYYYAYLYAYYQYAYSAAAYNCYYNCS